MRQTYELFIYKPKVMLVENTVYTNADVFYNVEEIVNTRKRKMYYVFYIEHSPFIYNKFNHVTFLPSHIVIDIRHQHWD